MKSTILTRIINLGGNIDKLTGESLKFDLESLVLKTPLYLKPVDTPWSKAEDTEPIEGLAEFAAQHENLLTQDRNLFYDKLLGRYYGEGHENEPNAQSYFVANNFTPFTYGTADFEEWNGIIDEDFVRGFVKGDRLDFMLISWSYSYPDTYFICLSDPNPDNPTVYGTDHEEYFSDIEPYGTLEEFLFSFYTKKELIEAFEHAVK